MGLIGSHGMAYAIELGWPVFPVSINKRPLIKSEVEGQGGRHEATTSEVTLGAWDDRFPAANIALATGHESGIVVIDIDGEEGLRNFDTLIGKIIAARPVTVEAETGGGGRHLYFVHPGGTVRSRCGRIAPKIDVRGDGASAVLPPSRHESGRDYRWLVSPFERAPARFPIGFLQFVRDPMPNSSTPKRRFERSGDVDIDRWLQEAAGAPEGQRNHALNHAAFIIARVLKERREDDRDAFARLVSAGVSAGLPKWEAQQTVRSGLRAGRG